MAVQIPIGEVIPMAVARQYVAVIPRGAVRCQINGNSKGERWVLFLDQLNDPLKPTTGLRPHDLHQMVLSARVARGTSRLRPTAPAHQAPTPYEGEWDWGVVAEYAVYAICTVLGVAVLIGVIRKAWR